MITTLIFAATLAVGQVDHIDGLSGWSYPGAHTIGASGPTGSRALNTQAHFSAMLTSRADFGDVVDWYQAKVDATVKVKPGSMKVSREGVVSHLVIDDSATQTLREGRLVSQERPFKMRMISWRKDSDSMTIVITRGDTEGETHIAIMGHR